MGQRSKWKHADSPLLPLLSQVPLPTLKKEWHLEYNCTAMAGVYKKLLSAKQEMNGS